MLIYIVSLLESQSKAKAIQWTNRRKIVLLKGCLTEKRLPPLNFIKKNSLFQEGVPNAMLMLWPKVLTPEVTNAVSIGWSIFDTNLVRYSAADNKTGQILPQMALFPPVTHFFREDTLGRKGMIIDQRSFINSNGLSVRFFLAMTSWQTLSYFQKVTQPFFKKWKLRHIAM